MNREAAVRQRGKSKLYKLNIFTNFIIKMLGCDKRSLDNKN